MKKMNLLSGILFIFLSSLSLMSQGQNTVLTGELKGLAGKTVKITYTKDAEFKTDSVAVIKDIFTWKGNLNEPQLISLTIGQNSYSYFMGPGYIKLTNLKDAGQSYKISGSPMQQDAEAFSASLKDLTDQEELLSISDHKATIEEKAVLDKKRTDLEQQKKNRADQFIAGHPKSFFSIYLVTGRTSYGYTEAKLLYDKLDESAKRTEAGKKLAEKLEALKRGLIGSQIPDFAQADTSGNVVKLSSFKGKYVLVDFWASWCGPCRAENPNVLKVYNAYKDKGFTVAGISLDDKAASWKNAIRIDKMPWVQLSDLRGWKNAISASFGIESIPSNLLIDPSGKIIARDLRGAMLESKLKELLN